MCVGVAGRCGLSQTFLITRDISEILPCTVVVVYECFQAMTDFLPHPQTI